MLPIEQGTSHSPEFPDLFPENILCDLKMISETCKAKKLCGTAIDQFPCERFFISGKLNAAANAQIPFIHGKEPGSKDTVSYHAPGLPD